MKNELLPFCFLSTLSGCTLTFESGKPSQKNFASLGVLTARHCHADPQTSTFSEIFEALRKKWEQTSCREVLTKLAGVDYLDLSGMLAAAPQLKEQLRFLEDFPGIIHLKLSYNDLADINELSQLKQLQFVYLDHNNIKSLEPLRGFSLQWLDISKNQVTSLEPILGMASLQDLYAESNPLATTPQQEAWPQLKNLHY